VHEQRGSAVADDTSVRFWLPDPHHALAGARLWQEVRVPGDLLDFSPTPDGWELELPRPAVRRMEYMLELKHRDGGIETILDPANPLVARGVFGDHSVLEMPGYRRPAWLSLEATDSTRLRLVAPASGGLRTPVSLELWAPADAEADEPLPLLVAHDGPEYDDLSALTHYFGAQIAAGAIPRGRLALLAPGDRNARYSASRAYARTLVESVLPVVNAASSTAGRPVIMGASLGGLAALHAEMLFPGTFGGLFLQSGSFFQPRHDGPGHGVGRYWRITDAVGAVLAAAPTEHPVEVTMTCGALEENVSNNRVMARRLKKQGHLVRFTQVPDVHTYTAWRDAFHPHLTKLLQRCFGPA